MTDLKLSLYHEKYKSNSGKITLLLLPGPYSLNGYRVRVYRQDSATQWFTGIITHHDLFSRNMVVMNDQVNLNMLVVSAAKFLYRLYVCVIKLICKLRNWGKVSVSWIPENHTHMVSKTETERNLFHQCLLKNLAWILGLGDYPSRYLQSPEWSVICSLFEPHLNSDVKCTIYE